MLYKQMKTFLSLWAKCSLAFYVRKSTVFLGRSIDGLENFQQKKTNTSASSKVLTTESRIFLKCGKIPFVNLDFAIEVIWSAVKFDLKIWSEHSMLLPYTQAGVYSLGTIAQASVFFWCKIVERKSRMKKRRNGNWRENWDDGARTHNHSNKSKQSTACDKRYQERRTL